MILSGINSSPGEVSTLFWNTLRRVRINTKNIAKPNNLKDFGSKGIKMNSQYQICATIL
jgi:hypothetical protein